MNSPNQQEAVRSRLQQLLRTGEELAEKREALKARASFATERLRDAEDAHVAGQLSAADLRKRRVEAADALREVLPAEQDLAEHSKLIQRCEALLRQAEAVDAAAAAVELGRQHSMWRGRFARKLLELAEISGEGEAIEREIDTRAPGALAPYRHCRVVPDFTGNNGSRLNNWLFDLRSADPTNFPPEATALLAERTAAEAARMGR